VSSPTEAVIQLFAGVAGSLAIGVEKRLTRPTSEEQVLVNIIASVKLGAYFLIIE
jgi:hypothetical protein